MRGHYRMQGSTDRTSGDTPLITACWAGDLHEAEVLIQAGAKITAVNEVSFLHMILFGTCWLTAANN